MRRKRILVVTHETIEDGRKVMRNVVPEVWPFVRPFSCVCPGAKLTIDCVAVRRSKLNASNDLTLRCVVGIGQGTDNRQRIGLYIMDTEYRRFPRFPSDRSRW